MNTVACPKCEGQLRLPFGVDHSESVPPDVYALCPWCRETLTLREVMSSAPPLLQLFNGDGNPYVVSTNASTETSLDNSPYGFADSVASLDTPQSSLMDDAPVGRSPQQTAPIDDTIRDFDSAPSFAPARPASAQGGSASRGSRRKKSRSSAITLLMVILGGAMAIPLAIGILMLIQSFGVRVQFLEEWGIGNATNVANLGPDVGGDPNFVVRPNPGGSALDAAVRDFESEGSDNAENNLAGNAPNNIGPAAIPLDAPSNDSTDDTDLAMGDNNTSAGNNAELADPSLTGTENGEDTITDSDAAANATIVNQSLAKLYREPASDALKQELMVHLAAFAESGDDAQMPQYASQLVKTLSDSSLLRPILSTSPSYFAWPDRKGNGLAASGPVGFAANGSVFMDWKGKKTKPFLKIEGIEDFDPNAKELFGKKECVVLGQLTPESSPEQPILRVNYIQALTR